MAVYSRASTEPEDGEEEGGPMGAEGGPDNGYGVASQPPSHQSPDIGPCAVSSGFVSHERDCSLSLRHSFSLYGNTHVSTMLDTEHSP